MKFTTESIDSMKDNNISPLALKTAQHVCAIGDVGGIEHNAKTIQGAVRYAQASGATTYARLARKIGEKLKIPKSKMKQLEELTMKELEKTL